MKKPKRNPADIVEEIFNRAAARGLGNLFLHCVGPYHGNDPTGISDPIPPEILGLEELTQATTEQILKYVSFLPFNSVHTMMVRTFHESQVV